ncbi:acyl-CoA dehydrogenase family member 11-like isoform X1 [Lissotriton helveticus]
MAEDQCGAVLEEHRFNQRALERYLEDRLPGFPTDSSQALAVGQYRYGRSNPTFHLQKGPKQYVLRKKPPGLLLPGTHQIAREYTVQRALTSVGFPVPRPLLYCEDTSVIGTEFYIMEHVQGRIFRYNTIAGVSPAEQCALNVAVSETLAWLHSLNLDELNLPGKDSQEGYCKREVLAWKELYEELCHVGIPSMNELSEWLLRNLPITDDEPKLLHGDFRIPNVIFHPTEARVVAVLDWELSSIGPPVADLAYFSVLSVMSTQTNTDGYKIEDLVSVYYCRRNVPPLLNDWNFFLALAFFKMAAYCQVLYSGSLLGNSNKKAHHLGEMVKPLAEHGLKLTKKTITVTKAEAGAPDATDELFLKSKKGDKILHQVKEFMKQYVYPSEQTASKEEAEYCGVLRAAQNLEPL